MKNLLKPYAPIAIFIVIALLVFAALFLEIFATYLAYLDTAFAIALGVFALSAYWQYSRDQHRQSQFLNSLDQARDIESKDGAVIIHFGGSNQNMIQSAKDFINKTLPGISEELIVGKKFGDENGKVDRGDIKKLEEFLQKEIMLMLAHREKIHIFIAGMGVASYVCADILGNWKTIYVYHYNGDKYEAWYIDQKSRQKQTVQKPKP